MIRFKHCLLAKEDISKHAGVTQEITLPNLWQGLYRGTPNSVCGLLKPLAVIVWIDSFFSGEPPPPPPLSYGVEKRRDHRNFVAGRQISVIPPLLTIITPGGGGGGGGEKVNPYDHS